MTKAARISYAIMAVLLVLIAWLHLGPLMLTSLFGYFAIRVFSFGRSRALGIAIYVVVVAGIGYGLFYFTREAYKQFPEIAGKTIPAVVEFAKSNDIELPFQDYETAKTALVKEVNERLTAIGRYIRAAAYAFAQVLIGLVVAASLYLSGKWGHEEDANAAHDSLYTTVVRELATRFRCFFASFAKVIGAQIVISIINTLLTTVFLLWQQYDYVTVIIMVTFLCGLLPIIGNIMSNTLIVGVGFTISPHTAFFALGYLVVIHKLEYFLNSKIIGERIKNPMWLTLIGLVVGEKLMGIPGMILAPVVLHYVKVEASRSKLNENGQLEANLPEAA